MSSPLLSPFLSFAILICNLVDTVSPIGHGSVIVTLRDALVPEGSTNVVHKYSMKVTLSCEEINRPRSLLAMVPNYWMVHVRLSQLSNLICTEMKPGRLLLSTHWTLFKHFFFFNFLLFFPFRNWSKFPLSVYLNGCQLKLIAFGTGTPKHVDRMLLFKSGYNRCVVIRFLLQRPTWVIKWIIMSYKNDSNTHHARIPHNGSDQRWRVCNWIWFNSLDDEQPIICLLPGAWVTASQARRVIQTQRGIKTSEMKPNAFRLHNQN